jgi:hypothetical protein
MVEIEFPKLIQELYATVGRLENMFPGRHFTPDGHLIGSIGEALASYYYGVELHRASFERDGSFEEVYNGPGAQVWAHCNPAEGANNTARKRGQYHVSLFVLKKLMAKVLPAEKLPLCK